MQTYKELSSERIAKFVLLQSWGGGGGWAIPPPVATPLNAIFH